VRAQAETYHLGFVDYLRIIAIILVIMIHTMALHADLPGGLRFLIKSFLGGIISSAVPLFFSISGFVLKHRYNGANIAFWTFAQKRASKLLIPYFSLSMVYLLVRIPVEYYFYSSSTAIRFDYYFVNGMSIFKFLTLWLFARSAKTLYFLPVLTAMNILFPIINRHVGSILRIFILLLLVMLMESIVVPLYLSHLGLPDPDVILSFLINLKYFLFGIILYHIYCRFTDQIRKHTLGLFLSLAVVTMGVRHLCPITIPMLVATYPWICLLYLFSNVLSQVYRGTVVRFLADATFGIYLVHAPLIVYAFGILLRRMPMDPGLVQLSFVSLTYLVSLLAVVTVRKFKFLRAVVLSE
jgi:peptidoglycan/LPS O-acetylase OafA/YrhL